MISRNSDKILRKSRRNIPDLRRFQQHSAKISKNYRFFPNFRKKSAIFEFKAVQRYVYLVDLEKCQKMSIWLQKSASIQPRTSHLKNALLVVATTTKGPTLYPVSVQHAMQLAVWLCIEQLHFACGLPGQKQRLENENTKNQTSENNARKPIVKETQCRKMASALTHPTS